MSPKARVVRKPSRPTRTAPTAAPPRSTRRSRYRAGFRPGWHKVVAVALFLSGAGLFFVCEFDGWHLHEHGGHVWYLVGIAIAASSTWWFGLFDRV